jgi:hypothetical protein
MFSKKILFMLFVSITLMSFFSGIFVGIYKIPPYELLNKIHDKFIDTKTTLHEQSTISQDVSSMIRINSTNDIIKERSNLIYYIWKQNDFPIHELPTKVITDFKDERYHEMSNLSRIDKISTEMEYGVTSDAYLFLAKSSNAKLVIYHQGHDGDFILGKNTIQFFLSHNYSVLALSMPLMGNNSQPTVDLPHFGKMQLLNHDDLQFLETNNFTPIKYFVHPIVTSLNYIDRNYNYDSFYMVGISGGGWTTAFYSAIDPRITKSFPVAGTAPMYLRFNNPKNLGDWEQMNPNLYNISEYLDQYIMASYGKNRIQLQIFNKNDPCCFSGTGYATYESLVKQKISLLGQGNFTVYLDENNMQHSISDKSLGIILQNMEN